MNLIAIHKERDGNRQKKIRVFTKEDFSGFVKDADDWVYVGFYYNRSES